MTLYDWIKRTEGSYDTYDTVYDGVVTVDWIDEETDFYSKFCNGIMKLVEFVNQVPHSSCEIVCRWTDMITRNIEVFKEFTDKFWTNKYEDDKDEFIYQWIKEIHYWVAGYVSESTYKDFVENYLPRMK